MNLNPIRAVAALSCALLLTACDQLPMPGDAGKQAETAPADTSPVYASVNGTRITRNMFDRYLQARQAQQPLPQPMSPEQQEQLLNEMVSMELVIQDAKAKGVDKQPEVVDMIELQSRNLLANAALRSYMENHPITDEQLQTEYQTRIADVSPKEYAARHILVDDEQTANDLIAKLDKGADFAKLAKENSKDSSAADGGNLGWFNPSQMVKPFADATAALEKGTYTKTPVQSQFGWHIIMLEDARDTQVPPFEQMKERVRAFMSTKQTQDYIESLRTGADVQITLPEPPAPPAEDKPDAPPAPDAATEPATTAAPAQH
jgi:peptidyl-prolyl cis-trans isomerase C